MAADADRIIAHQSSRRFGVVLRIELLAAGVSRRQIARRLDSKRLHRLHAGVYSVVPPEALHPLAPYAAALAAVGPKSGLSHSSAGALYDITPPGLDPIHVTVESRNPGQYPGIAIHRTKSVDTRPHRGLLLTSPLRTLQDVSRTRTPDATLERAISEAIARRLVTPAQLQTEAKGRLKRLATDRPGLTRSHAERLFRRLLARACLPLPLFNAQVAGYEVDAVWRQARLVVEIDGYAFHSSKRAFDRDRRKDLDLRAHGYTVMRFSYRQISEEPEAVIAAIARHLA